MKGVIFNVVEEVVTELFDEATWDALLDQAGVDGVYTALGNYPDAELMAIVGAAVATTGIETNDLLRTIGRHALKGLVGRMPNATDDASGTVEFLRQVNDIIHPEVLKLYPSATPPKFSFEDHDEGLIVHYQSARGLHALAAGLIEGCADLFDETVEVVELERPNVEPDTTVLLARVSSS